jgi:hypothetical protein
MLAYHFSKEAQMSPSNTIIGNNSDATLPPPLPNPVLTALESFVERTPFVTRHLLYAQLLSYLASWFVQPYLALANIPHFTLFRFEVYRLVLSPLVNTSLLGLILAFISFTERGKRLEYRMGSTGFAWLCFSIAFWTNVIFLVLCTIMDLVSDNNSAWRFESAQGIWLILFGILAMECVQAPAEQQRVLSWNLPASYYPIALFLLFSFFSRKFELAYVISLGIGYAAGLDKYPIDELTKLSNEKAKVWEETVLINVIRRPGWIVGHAASGVEAWSGDNTGGALVRLFVNSIMRQILI